MPESTIGQIPQRSRPGVLSRLPGGWWLYLLLLGFALLTG
jgi:hypothetical protein